MGVILNFYIVWSKIISFEKYVKWVSLREKITKINCSGFSNAHQMKKRL